MGTYEQEKSFERDLKMLNYFQSEFQYRHGLYWRNLVILFILDVIVTIIPLTVEVFGIKFADLPKSYPICFPLFGIMIAIFTYFILSDEAKKITAVNKAKYRISESMEEKYRYVNYVGDMSAKKNQLTFSLAKYVLIVELLLCVIVIGMILWDSNSGDFAVQEVCKIITLRKESGMR